MIRFFNFLKNLFSFKRSVSLDHCPYPVRVWVVYSVCNSKVQLLGAFFDYDAALCFKREGERDGDSRLLDYAVMNSIEFNKPIEIF